MEIGKDLIVKVMFKQRFKGGNRLNYAVNWEKNIPGRGKGCCKDFNVRACLFQKQQGSPYKYRREESK
jgi:hypothetical protein